MELDEVGKASGARSVSTAQSTVAPAPVLLLVFNRVETTRRVFESIRAARPGRLYVAADGPRAAIEGELQICEEVRRIATAVDWGCEVFTLFRSANLGLAVAVSAALTWFFQREECGIILEDDCVPSQSFFRFCTELLDYYKSDERVMHISGNNFQYGRRRGTGSYYFSKYPLVWGWATWQRAWSYFDLGHELDSTRRDVWAAQWVAALEKNAGLSVVPNDNLVTNIGFGREASHTTTIERYSFLKSREIAFPLKHPDQVIADENADIYTYYANFRNIRHLRLMPLYQAWDFVYAGLKTIKRGLIRGFHRAPQTRD